VIFLIENCEVVVKQEGEKRLVESDCKSDVEDVDEELVLEHSGQLCRLCASAVSEAVYIFGTTGKEQHIAEKINTCLPVTVSYCHCNSVVIQNSRFVICYMLKLIYLSEACGSLIFQLRNCVSQNKLITITVFLTTRRLSL
jgi:hypothetical protein